MVSVCLPSYALLQHLPSYLGFSYLGRGVSLHGCSSKAQPLLLTLDEGYLLTATLPDLQCGIAPLGPPAPVQPWLRVTEVTQSCPTLWDPMDCVAHQAPPSMEFSRQEYWSRLPFPSPGDVPDSGIKPRSPTLLSHQGIPWCRSKHSENKT